MKVRERMGELGLGKILESTLTSKFEEREEREEKKNVTVTI